MFAVQMLSWRPASSDLPVFGIWLAFGFFVWIAGLALMYELGRDKSERLIAPEQWRLVGAFILAFSLTSATLLAAEAVRGCEVIEDAPWWFRCFVCGNCLP